MDEITTNIIPRLCATFMHKILMAGLSQPQTLFAAGCHFAAFEPSIRGGENTKMAYLNKLKHFPHLIRSCKLPPNKIQHSR